MKKKRAKEKAPESVRYFRSWSKAKAWAFKRPGGAKIWWAHDEKGNDDPRGPYAVGPPEK